MPEMKTKVHVINDFGRNSHKKLMFEQSHGFDEVAGMAHALVVEWGKFPVEEDGEDSTGRSKARVIGPEEVVNRAFEAAQYFYDQAFARGHMVELPPLGITTDDN